MKAMVIVKRMVMVITYSSETSKSFKTQGFMESFQQ